MVYLVVFTKWPTDKTAELVKIGIEVAKKFPEDTSLGEQIIPNAFCGGLEGMRSLGVTDIKEGKLEEAMARARAILNMYATPVAGFEYSIEVWSNVEEAYRSIGQKSPE